MPASPSCVLESTRVLDGLRVLDVAGMVVHGRDSAPAVQDDPVLVLGAEGQRDLGSGIEHRRTQFHEAGFGEADRVNVLQNPNQTHDDDDVSRLVYRPKTMWMSDLDGAAFGQAGVVDAAQQVVRRPGELDVLHTA